MSKAEFRIQCFYLLEKVFLAAKVCEAIELKQLGLDHKKHSRVYTSINRVQCDSWANRNGLIFPYHIFVRPIRCLMSRSIRQAHLCNIYFGLITFSSHISYDRQHANPRATGKNCAQHKRTKMHFLLKHVGLLMKIYTEMHTELYSMSKIKNQLKQFNLYLCREVRIMSIKKNDKWKI